MPPVGTPAVVSTSCAYVKRGKKSLFETRSVECCIAVAPKGEDSYGSRVRLPTLLSTRQKNPDQIAAAPRTEKVCQLRTHALQQMLAHSITSSARVSSSDGTARPSALAVVRLFTKSNLV